MYDGPFFTDDHRAFAATLRRFVDRDLTPHVAAWDEAEAFPREVYGQAAALGLLGLGFPEDCGGTPGDPFLKLVAAAELARAGSGGLAAGLGSHGIALPPIVGLGEPDQIARLVPPVLRGEVIAALAVTEPGGGSDVAHLRTTATRDGDDYVVHGEKTFITSGLRADLLTVAVRTGGSGAEGLTLLAVEGQPAGLTRSPLKKMGWWCSDTAHLHFDGVRVPVANRIGPEGAGFLGLMLDFNGERLGLATMAWAFAEVCFADALAWAQLRETFGRPLIHRQVIRHLLVDLRMDIDAVRATVERLAWRVGQGERPVAEVCMAKNLATRTLEHVAGACVQVLGGAGYMRGGRVERIFRESKVLSIGGGASEVLKDLAAKQLGW
ncbi:MAG: acyl-CoA dehydrogenase [Myxococcales bacterium]|nr:acyl-CoA dehydrogenase [Myxococcales bacterium]